MVFGRQRAAAAEYFHVRPTPVVDDSFAIYGEVRPPELQRAYIWFEGKPITAEVPDPVVFERSQPDELLDLLITNASQLLVSSKTRPLIESASTCARAYAAEIRDDRKVISKDYFVVNLEQSFACMDLRRSRYEKSKFSGSILVVRRLVLSRSAIPATEGIFRLQEYRSYLICTAQFRQKVEDARLTGFEFLPAEVA